MRGFLIGVIFIAGLTVTVLSLRPGGLRRQLRLAARRFRIAIALGGIYVVGSLVIRIVQPSRPLSDYGLPALALVLAAAFVVIAAREPGEPVPRR